MRSFSLTLLAALTFSGFLFVGNGIHGEEPLADAVECRPRGGLPNVLAKLEAGEPVRVAYLGGSITAQPGWRVYTTKWLQEQYPKAKVSEIYAAIGGTGSTLGVYRNRKDVLAQKPDLLFIEFAVNDGGTGPDEIHRAMEGLVRQTWEADPKTDICFVYTIHENMLATLKTGKFPRSATAMEKIADYYAIPTIHMALEAAKLDQEGKLLMKAKLPKTAEEKAAVGDKFVFAPDGVHPHVETGHKMYLGAIQRSIPKCKIGTAGPHELKAPFRADNYSSARMEPVSKVKHSDGFKQLPVDAPLAKNNKQFMPEMWCGAPGESVTVKFKGTAVGFFDIMGPDAGELTYSVDGGPEKKTSRFDSYCTYHRMNSWMAASGLPDGEHTIVVKVTANALDKAAILSKRGEKMNDPKRFEGTNWNVGYIMLMGELKD
jgi:lysophospholipase L1-like esterase